MVTDSLEMTAKRMTTLKLHSPSDGGDKSTKVTLPFSVSVPPSATVFSGIRYVDAFECQVGTEPPSKEVATATTAAPQSDTLRKETSSSSDDTATSVGYKKTTVDEAQATNSTEFFYQCENFGPVFDLQYTG